MGNVAEEEVKVFQDQKVIRVSLVHLVQLGSLALMVQRVSGEIQGSKESLVSLERMVSQDHQEKEAPQEQMAHRVLPVSQASLAWQDPLEKQGQLENLVPLGQLEFLVIPEDQEMQEKKVLQDPPGLVENLAYQVNLGCQDFLERGDCRDCRYSCLI